LSETRSRNSAANNIVAFIDIPGLLLPPKTRSQRVWARWSHRLAAFALGLLLCQIAPPARAQWGQAASGDLSTAIRVDEVDPSARALLERVKAHVAENQWDEAVETLREVMQQQGAKLIRLDDSRYIPMRDYCQMRLAELPPPGRTLYRSRVDPLAKRWYDDGVAHRDAEMLRRVVDQLFLSSWADKALLALGDIELEEGDYSQARWCWERISPELRAPDGRPLWLSLRAASEAPAATAAEPAARSKGAVPPSAHWLVYPDTQLNLADIRARLVVASILEGSLTRARNEVDDFNRRHPQARGKIGGHEGSYAELLAGLLSAAEERPAAAAPTDWPTLGGSFDRTASAAPDPGLHTAWIVNLPLNDRGPFRTDISIVREFGLPETRPAEDQSNLLCFHPLVVGNLVLFNSVDKIYAFDLPTGKPAWPLPPPHDLGQIYSGLTGRENPTARNESGNQFHTFGVPRFTMTVSGRRLYARLGAPITSRPLALGLSTGNSYLVCLDLAAEGRLVWRIPQTSAEDDRWAFEGSPVCDGNNVYVAMRYNDVRPQEHVACYDAQTGMLRWRRLVCAAESPARGQADEITTNLLTLDHDMLYLNTNLGAVAAISTADGQVRWLSLYPRAKQQGGGSDRGANFYRDLNPCIYYRGSVLAAPADCEAILSLDSSTGQLLWASTLPRDVVHLLGVGGGNLLASGQRLWWLNVDGGKVVYRWPDQTTAHGYGRGALVGDDVYFPTLTAIHVFRQVLGKTTVGTGTVSDPTRAEVRDPIRLDTREPPLSGGNLVAADGYLLIATPNKLIALGPHAAPKPPHEHEVTQAAAVLSAEPPASTHDSAEP
jgi:outer membrane protein assembly factor BamB